jgi:hypothetical protein
MREAGVRHLQLCAHAAYAQQAHEIGAKVTSVNNFKDYMAVSSVAAEVLLKCKANTKLFDRKQFA